MIVSLSSANFLEKGPSFPKLIIDDLTSKLYKKDEPFCICDTIQMIRFEEDYSMDTIYYAIGTLMTITFFALVIATVYFIIKPHHLNKSKYINNPVSRQKVFIIGLVSIFVVLFGFSSVMAATEPVSVKQERITRELNEQKAVQAKLQQEKEAGAKQAQAVEKERLRKIEAAKPIIKTETKIEVIPFESVEQNDSSIALGEKRISVQGIDGERTITYDVTYINGAETSRAESKNEVTKQPVSQVTIVGTYVYVAPVQTKTTITHSESNSGCDPNYSGACVPIASDVDCAGGSGNGPAYVTGPVYVIGSDIYGLDRDGNGVGCE